MCQALSSVLEVQKWRRKKTPAIAELTDRQME